MLIGNNDFSKRFFPVTLSQKTGKGVQIFVKNFLYYKHYTLLYLPFY